VPLSQRARRLILLLFVAAGLAPTTWLYEPPPPRIRTLDLEFQALHRPPPGELARQLGPFRLERAWRMTSRFSYFGGYSALLPLGGGRLLAFSDRGLRLAFSPPGTRWQPPSIGLIVDLGDRSWELSDAESATIDPVSRKVWVGWENANTITRHTLAFAAFQQTWPRVMRAWGGNLGPEAMVRLADGRFVVLREGFSGLFENRLHQALLFAGDPVAGVPPRVFSFAGPAGFSPTDMAQLPDGRVLILMRRLIWPLPARFAGRIVIADPADIREGKAWHSQALATLESPLPIDNFEGLAIEPRANGQVTVWLISDDNGAVMQRTLLWKLALDPARVR